MVKTEYQWARMVQYSIADARYSEEFLGFVLRAKSTPTRETRVVWEVMDDIHFAHQYRTALDYDSVY